MASIKHDIVIPLGDLPSFLKEFASALETGESSDPRFAGIGRLRKMKCSVQGNTVNIRIKVEEGEAAVSHTPSTERVQSCAMHPHSAVEKPEFKALKKRMRKSFKMVFRAIHQGDLPPDEEMRAFISDAHLMVTYPGYGDAHYPVFIEACHAFEKAWQEKDMEALNQTVDALAFHEAHCHSQYK